MLLEPNETPYDVRFRLGAIPVRIHPMFWLMTVILGWSWIQRGGVQYVLVWMACVFVSILIHELGHVFMGLAFGSPGYIVLYSFGGLAVGSNRVEHWWQRVLVSLAGPFAGFLFLGLVILTVQAAMPQQWDIYLVALKYLYFHLDLTTLDAGKFEAMREVVLHPSLRDATFFNLFSINLFWGLLNLLPIWPLDGGQVTRDVLIHVTPGRGTQTSLGISFLVAALFAINSVVDRINGDRGVGFIPWIPAGGVYMAVLFGMLAVQSFMLLQQVSSRNYYDPSDPWGGQGRPWDR